MILSVNNTCDLVGDKANGRKTLAILLGPDKPPYLILCQGIIVYGCSADAQRSTLSAESSPCAERMDRLYRKMMKAGFDADQRTKHALVSKAFLAVFTFIPVLRSARFWLKIVWRRSS